MLTQTQLTALYGAAKSAVLAERSTGCCAELSVAQWCIESAWGSRSPGNNCFGIKVDGHGSGVQYFVSREFLNGTWVTMTEAFEKYDTLTDCFMDHARLITTVDAYRPAWQQYGLDHDLDALIGNVARRYASDPHYGQLCLELAHDPDVQTAIAAGRAAANILPASPIT